MRRDKVHTYVRVDVFINFTFHSRFECCHRIYAEKKETEERNNPIDRTTYCNLFRWCGTTRYSIQPLHTLCMYYRRQSSL